MPAKILWAIISLYAFHPVADASAFQQAETGEAIEKKEAVVPSFSYTLNGGQQVGSLKAGFVCLPKGKLRWADIGIPAESALSRALQAKLNSVMPGVNNNFLFGAALSGALENYRLRLCVAGLGIGEFKPKGRGEIDVRWVARDLDGKIISDKLVTVPFEFKDTDPRYDSSILIETIAQSFERFLNSG